MPRYNAPFERDRPPRFRPFNGGGPRYGGGNWRGPRPDFPPGGHSRDFRPPFRGGYGEDRDVRDRRMSFGGSRHSDDYRGSRPYDRQDSRDGYRWERQDSYPGTDTPPHSSRSHDERKEKEKDREDREPRERSRRSRWDTDSPSHNASAERQQDSRGDAAWENTEAVPMDMSPEHDSAEEAGAGDIVVDDAEQGKSAGIEQATSFDEALWRKSVPQRDSPLRNLDSSSNLSFSDTTSQPQQQPYTAQNLYPTSGQGHGAQGHSQNSGYGSGPHSVNSSVPNTSSNSPAMTPSHVPSHLAASNTSSGHALLTHTASAPLSHGHPFSSTPHRGGKQRAGSLSHQQSFPGGVNSLYNSPAMRGSGPNTPTAINRGPMMFGGQHQQGMIARQRIEATLANDKTILAHLVNWPTEPIEKKLHQQAEESRKLREREARLDMDLRKSYSALEIAELKVAVCDKRREAIRQELLALERPVVSQ